MTAVMADTHAVLWALFEPAKLSAVARAALANAAVAGDAVFISAISVVELRYLVEKGRVPAKSWDGLIAAVLDPAIPVELLPVDLPVARALEHVSRAVVPDLPDRIIAATALAHRLPLVTRDSKIRASAVPTIW